MTFLEIARGIHISAGFVALATFWLPMLVKKGGRLHRRVGWVYVGAMAIVAVTALAICVYRVGFTEDADRRQSSIFLFYVALLSATSASMGVRVLRAKQRTAAHRSAFDLGLPACLVLAGLGLLGYGVHLGAVLFMSFAPVGIFVGGGQLFYWLRPPQTKMHWWFEHMGGMIGSSIATLTAFLVVNAGRIGLARFGLVVWLVPTLIGVPGLRLWQRHYRAKFERKG